MNKSISIILIIILLSIFITDRIYTSYKDEKFKKITKEQEIQLKKVDSLTLKTKDTYNFIDKIKQTDSIKNVNLNQIQSQTKQDKRRISQLTTLLEFTNDQQENIIKIKEFHTDSLKNYIDSLKNEIYIRDNIIEDNYNIILSLEDYTKELEDEILFYKELEMMKNQIEKSEEKDTTENSNWFKKKR